MPPVAELRGRWKEGEEAGTTYPGKSGGGGGLLAAAAASVEEERFWRGYPGYATWSTAIRTRQVTTDNTD